jgi:uncharacterized protein
MVPIAERLFVETPEGPRLIGGRQGDVVVFPLPEGPEGERYAPVLLSASGNLWSWTVQRFAPKSPPYQGADSPETFVPFVLGYVELPGETIVETRLVNVEPAQLKIGQPMRLKLVPFATKSGDRLIYAFEPA